jgi:hypothetical protein
LISVLPTDRRQYTIGIPFQNRYRTGVHSVRLSSISTSIPDFDIMMQGWRAARARFGGALRRRWSSTGGNKAQADKAEVQSVAVPSRTPGVTRIRRAGGGAEKDLEVDSTIARIVGSDWGDRRGQTVSLPMRIYWVIFGLVLANGAYTYFAGKDGRPGRFVLHYEVVVEVVSHS